MTVQRAGSLTLTATDFKTTHKGVEIGVKCFAWDPTMPIVSIVERMPSGEYQATYVLTDFDDSNTLEAATRDAGGVVMWIKTVLLPAINAALLKRFPPSSGDPGSPGAGSIDDVDAKLGVVLGWAPKADGTLQVTTN